MKKLFKRVAVGTLCMTLLFGAGCSSKTTQEDAGPMGRYVETILSYPDGQVMRQRQRTDGSLDVYVYDERIRDMVLYNSRNGVSWEEKEIPGILVEGMSPIDYVYGRNGEIYMLNLVSAGGYQDSLSTPAKMSYIIYHIQADGSFAETEIHWEGESGATSFYDTFLVGDDGDFFVLQLNEGIKQYDGQTGELKRVYQLAEEADGADIVVQNNSMKNLFVTGFGKLFVGDYADASIRIYDASTGEIQTITPFENLTTNSLMCLGSDGDLYIQNTGGLYRLVENGTLWEQIIDGSLNTLSTPVQFTDLFVDEEKNFFLRGRDRNADSKLYCYQYDETVPSVPKSEIVVYSLQDNYLIRHAVGAYQRKHPDTKVNLQLAPDSQGTLQSELIRALNTELLAGKGPDIIVFDNLNLQSYIAKDALLDISDVIVQSEDLLDHIVNCFAEDGAAYAIPAGFRLPIFAAEHNTLAQTATLREAARFAQENPQAPLLVSAPYKTVFQCFLPSSAPAFLKDGQIDQTVLREYLECVKDITDASEGNGPADEDRHPIGFAFDFALRRSHGYAASLQSMFSVGDVSVAMEHRGDCGLELLPGLSSRVFIPNNIVGVNVNTAEEEKAKEFINVLLSEEVQKNQTYGGFPVNEKALLNSIEFSEEPYIGPFFNVDPEGEVMFGTFPPTAMQQRVYELILSAETPSVLDATLVEMISREAEGYFSGDKTIEQAISDIEEATKLYLSE